MNLLKNTLKFTLQQKKYKYKIVFHHYQYMHTSVTWRFRKISKISVPHPTLGLGYMKKSFLDRKYTSSGTYENLISQSKFCNSNGSAKNKQAPEPDFRHQFNKETEDLLNSHITEEFNAAFAYLSMACYFGRSDVALAGCQGFFIHMYQEELSHAMVFLNYVLLRGGYVILNPIQIPENQDWKSIVNALSISLDMEKDLKEKLNVVFKVAERHEDLQLMDLISTQFMEEQNRSICELSRLLTKAKMTVDEVGLYLFDRMVFESFVKKSKDNLMYMRALDKDESDGYYK